MATAVHFRSAVALLGRFPALAGVDLDIERGEVVLVEGPNGAGKTSLLRACAGLLPVVSGTAEVLGHDLRRKRRAVRRQVGVLGHRNGLYDDLNVEENLRFAVRAAGGDGAAVGGALDRVGLGGRLRTVAASGLSAGQRRRLALAAVIARDPALWLLDEPHAGLDAEGRDLFDDVVADAHRRGATFLISSHEGDRVRPLATRVVTVAGGAVVAAQEPLHVA